MHVSLGAEISFGQLITGGMTETFHCFKYNEELEFCWLGLERNLAQLHTYTFAV